MGGACPDVFLNISEKQGNWVREANRQWFISSHTLQVSHVMGLPSCFLCAHSPYLPELESIDNDVGGLHPPLEGRGQVGTSGVEGPKKKERG